MASFAKDRWTSGADYDRWMGRWSRLLAHEFLNWLQLPSGLRWIDVCCGSGMLTEAIVERNTPAGVVGIDASPHQVDFARQHRACENVTFDVGNAVSLTFLDATFDVAVSGLGLNFIPEPAKGLEGICPCNPSPRDCRNLRVGLRAGCAFSPRILGCRIHGRSRSRRLRSSSPFSHMHRSRLTQLVRTGRLEARNLSCSRHRDSFHRFQ